MIQGLQRMISSSIFNNREIYNVNSYEWRLSFGSFCLQSKIVYIQNIKCLLFWAKQSFFIFQFSSISLHLRNVLSVDRKEREKQSTQLVAGCLYCPIFFFFHFQIDTKITIKSISRANFSLILSFLPSHSLFNYFKSFSHVYFPNFISKQIFFSLHRRCQSFFFRSLFCYFFVCTKSALFAIHTIQRQKKAKKRSWTDDSQWCTATGSRINFNRARTFVLPFFLLLLLSCINAYGSILCSLFTLGRNWWQKKNVEMRSKRIIFSFSLDRL